MKAILIEDETAAVLNFRALLIQVAPQLQIETVLESVADSIAWFQSHPAPDLVFMDIHLADGDAFRIFPQAEISCPIIFTTAYDRYALEAFRVNSIDYLLKPIKTNDLRRALEKFERLTGGERNEYVRRVGQHMARQNDNAPCTFLVHTGDRIIPLPASEIAYCYTAEDRVSARTYAGKELPLDGSLEAILGQLPADDFFRANRQFIVARRAVRDVSVWFGSRLAVNLTVETPERIVISKVRVPFFKRWLAGS